MTAAPILALLMGLVPYYGDRSETAEERRARLAPVAEVIASVTRTRAEAVLLVALGKHESNFAALVQEGRCAELGPHACDSGKARGVWQIQQAACPAAYAFPAGSLDSLRAEATCAIRLLRWSADRGRSHTLTPIRAAFCGFAGKAWGWPGAEARERTVKALFSRWGKH